VIVGICSCGSYYSPWFPYTLASIYGIVDRIVVVNGGYDLRDPRPEEYNVPLEEVTKDIEHLDVEGKIVEVKDFTLKDLRHPLVLETERHHRSPSWADMRGVGLTLAYERALDLGADWVLKTDSDQVCYANCTTYRRRLGSVIFKQYEFCGDIHHLCDPGPDSPWNDSVYTLEAHPATHFGGGGAPCSVSHRVPVHDCWCAHLRHANPIDATEGEKLRHFRDRLVFHLFTNEFGRFCPELFERAERTAREMLKRRGKPSPVRPPEACLVERKHLREYIGGEIAWSESGR